MTVLGLLALRKRFVAVANTALADNHQGVMLRRIASQSSLIWTENPSDVGNCIARAMKQDAAVWTGPSLAHDLNAYIGQLK